MKTFDVTVTIRVSRVPNESHARAFVADMLEYDEEIGYGHPEDDDAAILSGWTINGAKAAKVAKAGLSGCACKRK